MSINFCTLNSFTINTLCGNKRAQLLEQLIPILHPPIPDNIGHASGNAVAQQRWAQRTPWEPPIVSTERDNIIVSVTLQHLYGEQEQIVDNRLDIVYITDINIEPTQIFVNIKNLKIN